MERVVTIVAKPPEECGPHRRDSEIEKVFEEIDRQKTDDHILARAATLEELRDILVGTLLDPPALVQIIGHGSPGVLLLGEAWRPRCDQLPSGAKLYLNSNLSRYQVLDGCVARRTTVLLLGCAVGAPAEKELSDGPTLLFDLVRMWRCEAVAAPVVLVVPKDFVGGVYRSAGTLTTARGLCVTLGSKAAALAVLSGAKARPTGSGIGAERSSG